MTSANSKGHRVPMDTFFGTLLQEMETIDLDEIVIPETPVCSHFKELGVLGVFSQRIYARRLELRSELQEVIREGSSVWGHAAVDAMYGSESSRVDAMAQMARIEEEYDKRADALEKPIQFLDHLFTMEITLRFPEVLSAGHVIIQPGWVVGYIDHSHLGSVGSMVTHILKAFRS